jgi:S1-C subfamily serine protease
LNATDSYQHTWLGVFGTDITPDIAEALGLSSSQGRGSPVMDEDEGTPAGNANAGLHGGDMVVNNIN